MVASTLFFDLTISACTSKLISLGGVERGPGLWKFNVLLLQNEAFCTGVHDFWCNWHLERRRFSLLSNWYEAGKVRLCRFIIDFFRNLARENKSKFTELDSRLAALEGGFAMVRIFPRFFKRLGLSLMSTYPIKLRVLCYGRRSGRQQKGKDQQHISSGRKEFEANRN